MNYKIIDVFQWLETLPPGLTKRSRVKPSKRSEPASLVPKGPSFTYKSQDVEIVYR